MLDAAGVASKLVSLGRLKWRDELDESFGQSLAAQPAIKRQIDAPEQVGSAAWWDWIAPKLSEVVRGSVRAERERTGLLALLGTSLTDAQAAEAHERDERAAAAYGRSRSWLLTESEQFGGLRPKDHLVARLAEALAPDTIRRPAPSAERPASTTVSVGRDALPDTLHGGTIRDPVHGYVRYTALEAALLDTAIAQRLRYVSQSACAPHVFPAVTTSRFEHSLGTMNVASRLLVSSVENAFPQDRQRFLQGLREAINRRSKNLFVGGNEAASERETFLRNEGCQAAHVDDIQDRVALLVADQATRLAALFHDLGHLPFSHDAELALTEWLDSGDGDPLEALRAAIARHGSSGPGSKALHEAVGGQVAQWLVDSTDAAQLPEQISVKHARLLSVALNVAADVMAADPRPTTPGADADGVLSYLHLLVDGEIDADRIDYVMRDGRAFALPGVAFDADRLINNVALVTNERGARYELAILPGGVSPAEDFLVSRFRLYVWAINHHKSQGIAVGLRQAMLAFWKTDDGKAFLRDYNALLAADNPTDELVDRIVRWDDETCRVFLRGMIERRDDGYEDAREFVYRAPARRRALWKRLSDLEPDQAERLRILAAGEDRPLTGRVKAVRQQARELGVELVTLGFVPYRIDLDPSAPEQEAQASAPASELQVREGTESQPRFQPLTDRAPLVASLAEAWRNSPNFLAYVSSDADPAARARLREQAFGLIFEE